LKELNTGNTFRLSPISIRGKKNQRKKRSGIGAGLLVGTTEGGKGNRKNGETNRKRRPEESSAGNYGGARRDFWNGR